MIKNDTNVEIKNLNKILGFKGALLAKLLLSTLFWIGLNPKGKEIKKTGHHITKKNIMVSKIDIKLLLVLLTCY